MKAVREIVRKYYKYIYESWTQPVLTSNGEMGSDTPACSVTYGSCRDGSTNTSLAYCAFDRNSSTRITMWSGSTTTPQTITFYNPEPIKFENMVITFGANAYAIWRMQSGYLKGSNDGTNWEQITSFTQNASATLTLTGSNAHYKYFALTGTLLTQVTNSIDADIVEIEFINSEQVTVVESTQQDYDFYKDIPIYKIVKENDTYKAPRSWEKGQYYGN